MAKFDDKFFDENLADNDILAEDATVSKLLETGVRHIQEKKDTFRGYGNHRKDFEKVCMRCVRNVFNDSGITMPETDSVVTFMDAIAGIPVDLYGNPIDPNTGRRKKIQYADKDSWSIIDVASDIVPGDIMVVNNIDGGYHAVVVKNIKGDPDYNGLFQGYFSGVDVIHDRGAPVDNDPRSVQVSHYEWLELHEGQGGDKGPNRKFVRGYRYGGGK